MVHCSLDCKHNYCGYFCTKYQERIHKSLNPACFGLLWHPLEYLDTYYQKEDGLEHLIEIADKSLKDNKSRNILEWYKTKGFLTEKQRKYLVYVLLNGCYESKPLPKYEEYGLHCQIED